MDTPCPRHGLTPDAPPIYSCTIITTTASQDMGGIRDRMPTVPALGVFDVWLDPHIEDLNEVAALVRAAPPGTITHYAVGPRMAACATTMPS